MTDHGHDLIAHIGSTLRRQREQHRLTQAALAAQATVTQATVARIERGDRGPSVETIARLFAALGCRVRLTLEPLDKDIDEAITASAGSPLAARITDAGIPDLATKLATIPYVFVGMTAALLQGAPVPVAVIEIALARRDCDEFTRWLDKQWAGRWHRQYQEYGYAPLDPRVPGEPRWRIKGGAIIQVTLVNELPASIEVRHDQRSYQVLPLTEVEIADPSAARLLRRYRDLQARTAASS